MDGNMDMPLVGGGRYADSVPCAAPWSLCSWKNHHFTFSAENGQTFVSLTLSSEHPQTAIQKIQV